MVGQVLIHQQVHTQKTSDLRSNFPPDAKTVATAPRLVSDRKPSLDTITHTDFLWQAGKHDAGQIVKNRTTRCPALALAWSTRPYTQWPVLQHTTNYTQTLALI